MDRVRVGTDVRLDGVPPCTGGARRLDGSEVGIALAAAAAIALVVLVRQMRSLRKKDGP